MNVLLKNNFHFAGKLFLFVMGFSLVALINGSLPFIAMPTLGQAVGTTVGWAQSLINEGLFSVHSYNFGYPHPAARSFGLIGVVVVGFFMRLGIHGADAYSFMVMFWLIIAYYSAFKISRLFAASFLISCLLAVLWCILPIVTEHAGYSMLSLGIALLPFYFLAAFKIFPRLDGSTLNISNISLFIVACCISIFMDGYSFMMFATGSGLLLICSYVAYVDKRKYLLTRTFPVYILGFTVSYLLYAIYIGKPQFGSSPIDFFRGWGADLSFFVVPPKRILWFWDFLGLSVARHPSTLFGDSSVWMTTFILPLVVCGILSFWFFRKRNLLVYGFLLLALFGFYMSLGPSLKINSVRPETIGKMMPAEYAIAPTGNAIIYENIPGFKSMRASYRWAALGSFALWLLLAFALGQFRGQRKLLTLMLMALLLFMFVPNIDKKIQAKVNNRDSFLRIDADLLTSFMCDLSKNELIAFLPYRNDMLVNYIASKIGVRTYNIGGDKNLAEARKHWPRTMRQFPRERVDKNFASRVLLLLARDEADAVVLPYIDMLWAAHKWPCPVAFRDDLAPAVLELEKSGFVDLVDREFYATVRLKPQFENMMSFELETLVVRSVCIPPYCLKCNDFDASTPSRVGIVQDSTLVSSGKTGFLHFGPYVPMVDGQYQLLVKGAVNSSVSGYVDVVSDKGRVKHAKFPFKLGKIENGILAQGKVLMSESVEDLEVRVHVGSEGEVVLEGYKLTPWTEFGSEDK